ncbi:MAG TPA: DUF559 domain-containing protein [Kofleriaceae bacterium]|nr:DUF559 domain-containing protein [Kofleriaceae bacterium]
MGGWDLDAILSRQQRERERGGATLSVLPLAPAMAQAAWASWAARFGALVAAPARTAEEAFAALVQAVPRERLLDASRAALGAAMGLAAEAVDAAVASRSPEERRAWLADLGADRPEARLAGWAIACRVDGRELDGHPPMAMEEAARAAAILVGPIAVLLAVPPPLPGGDVSIDVLVEAARSAAAVCAALPRQPVGLAAPRAAIEALLASGAESASIALVRQGFITGPGEAGASAAGGQGGKVLRLPLGPARWREAAAAAPSSSSSSSSSPAPSPSPSPSPTRTPVGPAARRTSGRNGGRAASATEVARIAAIETGPGQPTVAATKTTTEATNGAIAGAIAGRRDRVGADAEVSASEGRSDPERVLHAALERDARTRGRFVLNGRLAIAFGNGPIEVDLLAAESRVAVEIDGWFHFRGPDDYRRDRRKDELLQRAGLLILRFLAEDATGRTDLVVDAIAQAIAARPRPRRSTPHRNRPPHEPRT